MTPADHASITARFCWPIGVVGPRCQDGEVQAERPSRAAWGHGLPYGHVLGRFALPLSPVEALRRSEFDAMCQKQTSDIPDPIEIHSTICRINTRGVRPFLTLVPIVPYARVDLWEADP
jgi:hypothetical protein